MVVEKGCIKRISTIRQIINGYNGNNDSCFGKSIVAIILKGWFRSTYNIKLH